MSDDFDCGMDPTELAQMSPGQQAELDQMKQQINETVMEFLGIVFNGRLALQRGDQDEAARLAHQSVHLLVPLDQVMTMNVVNHMATLLTNEVAAKYDWDYERILAAVNDAKPIFACQCSDQHGHVNLADMEAWLNA